MAQSLKDKISLIEKAAGSTSLDEALSLLTKQFPGRVIFSTSFSFEDQAISHIILSNELPVKIFTLDTGRLFPETYSVWRSTNEKYNTRVQAYYPDAIMLENFVSQKGPNSFYESVDNRKECCHIRKVVPLKRALLGNEVWITGLRAEHSADRHDMPRVEWDETNSIIKYHPLLHWTTGEVKQFINKNNIPYNPLHDKGFVSIGCAPCTRAIRPGEDFRAGRWWWEDNSKKECGLHVHQQARADEIKI
ncbi:MAG TPA: phosphoadenylyl-sulfate reductase [Chitinophagaceae bacterium]|nr:phosphoadenylyl-sulfate reductase [Chitinophagaceae bacterium]